MQHHYPHRRKSARHWLSVGAIIDLDGELHIIEAWHNREYFPCVNSRPAVTYLLGGHLATIRSLRTGNRQQLAEQYIYHADDNFRTRDYGRGSTRCKKRRSRRTTAA